MFSVELDSLLSTLELNFFVTKYYEMSDRDGRRVSVFALNFGLCEHVSIAFGRPSGKREQRLYFVERIFDYTPILHAYVTQHQEIRCNRCRDQFGFEKLEALKIFGMSCPTCREGTCEIINLSKKYEAILREVDLELLLPRSELGILQVLASEKQKLSATDIAQELDCSYQLVGKRGKILEERGLVKRTRQSARRRFEITPAAEVSYFTVDPRDSLVVSQE